MRNYLRVVPVFAVCLSAAMLVQPVTAQPKQNFGPASGSMPEAEAPKAQKPKATPAPVAATPKVVSTDSVEVKKLRAELDAARADAAQAKRNAARVAALEQENKELGSKLAVAEKRANVKPAAPVDSAEVKSLRAQLSDARKEAEQARSKSSRVAELEKRNTDLAAKLEVAEKTAAAAPDEAPDARIMKRLREENSYLRNLLDTHASRSPELKGQLRRYEK